MGLRTLGEERHGSNVLERFARDTGYHVTAAGLDRVEELERHDVANCAVVRVTEVDERCAHRTVLVRLARVEKLRASRARLAESVRLADRAPICVSTTWLSAERFADAGKVFANVRSMTKLLAHYGIRDFRRASTRITAAIVDGTDAARLDLALGRPILVVDSTDVDADGRPLVTKRSRFAAERVVFLVENS